MSYGNFHECVFLPAVASFFETSDVTSAQEWFFLRLHYVIINSISDKDFMKRFYSTLSNCKQHMWVRVEHFMRNTEVLSHIVEFNEIITAAGYEGGSDLIMKLSLTLDQEDFADDRIDISAW